MAYICDINISIMKNNKQSLLKKIATIQGKMQDLWAQIDSDHGMHCQTVMRELNELEKKIERSEVKGRK